MVASRATLLPLALVLAACNDPTVVKRLSELEVKTKALEESAARDQKTAKSVEERLGRAEKLAYGDNQRLELLTDELSRPHSPTSGEEAMISCSGKGDSLVPTPAGPFLVSCPDSQASRRRIQDYAARGQSTPRHPQRVLVEGSLRASRHGGRSVSDSAGDDGSRRRQIAPGHLAPRDAGAHALQGGGHRLSRGDDVSGPGGPVRARQRSLASRPCAARLATPVLDRVRMGGSPAQTAKRSEWGAGGLRQRDRPDRDLHGRAGAERALTPAQAQGNSPTSA